MEKVLSKKAYGLIFDVNRNGKTDGCLTFSVSDRDTLPNLPSLQIYVNFSEESVTVRITKTTDGVNSIAYVDKFLSKLYGDVKFTANGLGIFGVKILLNYSIGGDVWEVKIKGTNTLEKVKTLYISSAYVEPFFDKNGKTKIIVGEKNKNDFNNGKIKFLVKNANCKTKRVEVKKEQEPLKDFVFPNYLTPLWKGDTVFDEPIMFVANCKKDGKILTRPKAKLMFFPDKILSVKWYYHIGKDKVFIELDPERDFTVKDGYLIAKGKIKEENYYNSKGEKFSYLSCGNVPFITNRQILGIDTFSGMYPESNSFDKSIKMLSTDGAFSSSDFYKDAKENKIVGNYFLPFTESTEIIQMQLSVTYKHSDSWKGKTPRFYGDTSLKRTYDLLSDKSEREFNLLYVGDSITEGAHCSLNFNIPPFIPHWTKAFPDNLTKYFNKEIKVKNVAVGGWTSNEGVRGHNGQSGLADRFSCKNGDKYLMDFKPDLAVIGYGMNDATNGNSVEFYTENIRSLIKTVRNANKNADIILIGTMNPNIKAAWFYNEQQKYLSSLYKIAKEEKGVAVIDMGNIQKNLLLRGKRFIELTSNNINHTGDFTNRMYAVNLISALIKL